MSINPNDPVVQQLQIIVQQYQQELDRLAKWVADNMQVMMDGTAVAIRELQQRVATLEGTVVKSTGEIPVGEITLRDGKEI